MRRLMALLSWCSRSVDRLLGVFPDWFGTDKVQASVILAGVISICLGVMFEIGATLYPTQLGHKLVVLFKFVSLALISIGASITAAGIVFRVTQKKDVFRESLEKAGVLFVGDRNAFNEVIGWDRWIVETRRCSELILIGKDQTLWAEDSAPALASVLGRGIGVTFIFQGDQCEQSLEKFWQTLSSQDVNQRFVEWRKGEKLKLATSEDRNGDYGYYWNGEKLIVKLYFDVANKREAPFVVFNVTFAAGKFDDADFSVASLAHVPFSEKKKMLVQVGLNMCKIINAAKLIPLR